MALRLAAGQGDEKTVEILVPYPLRHPITLGAVVLAAHGLDVAPLSLATML